MKTGKRLVAIILSISMFMQMFTLTSFASQSEDDVPLYREAVAGGEEMITQYPSGKIELLYGSYDLSEGGRDEAELVIVRRGGTQGQVAVTLKVVDISAVYNLDYRIEEHSRVLMEDETGVPYMNNFAEQADMASPGDGDVIDINIFTNPMEEEDLPEDISDILDYSQESELVNFEDQEMPLEELPSEDSSQQAQTSLRELRNEYFGNVSDRKEEPFRSATEEEQELYLMNQQDYFSEIQGISIPVTFEDGEYVKRFSIRALDDSIYESDEQSIFSLIDPVGAQLGDLTEGYLNIEDNDQPETAFISTESEIQVSPEIGGAAVITLTRSGAAETYTVVTVESCDGTALAGIHYEAVKTNVIFVPGALTRQVSIPLTGAQGEDLNFTVDLSAKGDVELSTDTVTILLEEPQTDNSGGISLLAHAPYDENTPNGPVTTYLAGAFTFTGWGTKPSLGSGYQPYTFNSSYGSVNRGGINFYGYSIMEWAWNNNAKSDFSKIDLNKSDGTVVQTVKNRTAKFKNTQYEKCAISGDVKKNATVIDIATDGKGNGKSKLNFYWIKLYKTPYKIILDKNIGTEDGKYQAKTDLMHERYIWTGLDAKTKKEGWFSSGNISMVVGNDTPAEYGPLYVNDTLSFSYAAETGTYLVGVKLAIDNTNGISDYALISLSEQNSVKLDADFIKKYYNYGKDIPNGYTNSSYVSSAHEYEFRGVFNRIPSDIRIISDKTMGYVQGFTSASNGDVSFTAHINDTLQLKLITQPGYVPKGIYVTRGDDKKFIAASGGNAYDYTIEVDDESITVEAAFVQPGLRVAPDAALIQSGLTSEIQKGNIFTILDKDEESSIKIGQVNGQPPSGSESYDTGKYTMATTDTQGGQYEIELRPVVLGAEYLFNSVTKAPGLPGAYLLPFWTDATGIIDLKKGEVEGNISEYRQHISENDPERYKDMVTGVYGSSYAFTPLSADAALYYQFVTMTNSGIINMAGGKISARQVSVFAKDGGYKDEYLPAAGAQVTLNGLKDEAGNPYITRADENGSFLFTNVKNMTSGMRYSASIEYSGQTKTTFVVGGSSLLEYKLDPYEVMNPSNMQIFTASKEQSLGTSISAGSVYFDDSMYTFVFDVYSNESQIQPQDAYMTFHAKNGSIIARYKAKEVSVSTDTSKPRRTYMISDICPANPRDVLPELTTGYTVNPTRILEAGAYLTITTTGNNGLTYPQVDTGIKFMETLNPLTTFSVDLNQQNPKPTSKPIPFLGNADGQLSFDTTIAESEEILRTGNYDTSLPFFSDIRDEYGSLVGKEAHFGLGITLMLKDTNLAIQTEGQAKIASMIMSADAEGIQEMAQSGIDAATALTQPAVITPGSQLVFQFGVRCRIAYNNDEEQWAFHSLLGIAYCTINLGDQTMLKTFNIFGIPLIAKLGIGGSVYGIISCGVDPRTTFIPMNEQGVDIMESYNNDSDWAMQLYLSGAIRGSFGLGIECLHVALSLEADIAFDFYSFKAGAGEVSLKVGYSLRLLLVTINGNFVDEDFPIYDYNYMDTVYSLASLSAAGTDDLMNTPLAEFRSLPRNYLNERSDWGGGGGLYLQSTFVGENNELMRGVYPYSGNTLADVSYDGQDRAMLLFMDDMENRDDNNRTALKYTIFDGSGWTMPELVAEDDSTADYEFSVADLGDSLVVCWENAKSKVDDEAGVDAALADIEVKAAVYDKAAGTFDEAFTVISNNYANRQPMAVDIGDGKIAFFYNKTEYDGTADEADSTETLVKDYMNAYSVIAYRIYDGATGGLADDESLLNTEDKLLIQESEIMETQAAIIMDEAGIETPVSESTPGYEDETQSPTGYYDQDVSLRTVPITDPYIVEYSVRPAQRDSKYYGVVAYTIDEDGEMETTYDRPIYLKTIDSDGVESKPVRLTNNGMRNSNLQFTSLEGSTLLTWVADRTDEAQPENNSSTLCYASIPLVIKNLEYHEGVYPYIDKSEGSDGEIVKELTTAEGGDTMTNFRVQSNDTDMLLSWIVSEATDEGFVNVLRAMRISAVEEEAPVLEEGDIATDQADLSVSYSEPFEFEMESSRAASVSETDLMYFGGKALGVWNKLESSDPGTDVESVRTLKYALVQPQPRLTMNHISIEGRPLAGETIKINASVQNKSFTDKNGNVTLTLYAMQNNIPTLLGSKVSQGTRFEEGRLSGGSTLSCEAQYTLPENIEGISLLAVVTADDGTQLTESLDIEVKPDLSFMSLPTTEAVSRDDIRLSFALVNSGNKDSSGSTVQVRSGDALLAQVNTGALAIDEEGEYTVSIPIEDSMFTEKRMDVADGYTETLPLTLISGDNIVAAAYSRNLPPAQVEAMEDAGEPVFSHSSLSLTPGSSIGLGAATTNGMNPDVDFVFTSSAPDIATVDHEGNVTAVGQGRAVIQAVLKPARTSVIMDGELAALSGNTNEIPSPYLIVREIPVTVSYGGGDDGDGGDGGGDVSTSIPDLEEAPGNTADRFTDIAGHWAEASIHYVVSENLFNGVTDTLFAPANPMTRGMVVTVLHRMDSKPPVSGESRFPDVASDKYYSDAVLWAEQNGIVTGFEGGHFNPDQNVSRAQFAAMLYRYMEYKKADSGKTASDSQMREFSDSGDIDQWAWAAMAYMVGNDIMQGNDSKELQPGREITRAEAAAMLERFCR